MKKSNNNNNSNKTDDINNNNNSNVIDNVDDVDNIDNIDNIDNLDYVGDIDDNNTDERDKTADIDNKKYKIDKSLLQTNNTIKLQNSELVSLNFTDIEDIEEAEQDDDNSNAFKVILIGDTNVGKTSFVKKLLDIDNKYSIATIGVDFNNYKLKYKNNIINSNIWDTAGLEKLNAIVVSYYRMIDGAILFFDLNNIDSFRSIEYWMNDIIYYIKTGIIYIIGNKTDLERKN